MRYYSKKTFGNFISTKEEILAAIKSQTIIIALVIMYDEVSKILKLMLPEGCTGLIYKPSDENDFTYQSLVGNQIAIRVTDQRDENTFICERESVLEEAKQYAFSHLVPGMIIKNAVVTSFIGYGAFLDLGGGVTGLLHIKEMDGSPKHPSETLKFGDTIPVAVKRMDKGAREVFLTQHLNVKVPLKDKLRYCFL